MKTNYKSVKSLKGFPRKAAALKIRSFINHFRALRSENNFMVLKTDRKKVINWRVNWIWQFSWNFLYLNFWNFLFCWFLWVFCYKNFHFADFWIKQLRCFWLINLVSAEVFPRPSALFKDHWTSTKPPRTTTAEGLILAFLNLQSQRRVSFVLLFLNEVGKMIIKNSCEKIMANDVFLNRGTGRKKVSTAYNIIFLEEIIDYVFVFA